MRCSNAGGAGEMGAECLCAMQVSTPLTTGRMSIESPSSNGCGLDIGVKNGKVVGVRGRITDRVNRGRLGPKGLHG
jgi:anaerobic selenocysteine-containing dehydrogenase